MKKCLARTQQGARCKNKRVGWLFCKFHAHNWSVFRSKSILVLTLVGLFAGINAGVVPVASSLSPSPQDQVVGTAARDHDGTQKKIWTV
jgi:hypothetical protein